MMTKKLYWTLQWVLRKSLLPLWGTKAKLNADVKSVTLWGRWRVPFGSKRWRIAYWSGLIK